MTDIVLPRLSQTGSNEWADVEANDVAIREVVNGELDNGNLSGTAGITDANLASPNNAAYREVLTAQGGLAQGVAAATYALGYVNGSSVIQPSGGAIINSTEPYLLYPIPFIYFDDADYTVSGKTQKLRLRAQAAVNATKPTIKFTVGLYPLTVAGSENKLTFTLGTVVSGSTVELNEPAASTVSQGNSGDFTIPSDGAYALGVVTSGTLTSKSAVLVSAQLQTRST